MEMTVEEIEQSVMQLSRDQLNKFRDWYMEFDATAWDSQANDVDYAWAELARKRSDELRSGAVKSVSWDEIKNNIRS